jgi:hypothetical protein
MNTFKQGLLLLLLLFLHTPTLADDITVCRERVDDAFMERYSGWQLSGGELVLTFSGVDWNAEIAGYTGSAMSGTGDSSNVTVLADGNSAMWAYYDADGVYVEVVGNGETVWCGEEWKPDAPSIPVVIESDCAHVFIRDSFDNWHLVTDANNPNGIVLHYGQALIGGNQSTDPTDYRSIPAACY